MPRPSSQYPVVLLCIFSTVLVVGVAGIALMARVLQCATKSFTAIAVLNLVFTHFLFLLTVPFRIHYYATGRWHLGGVLCRTVSAAIHIHMYMSFVFYVIILAMRLRTFRVKAEPAGFQRSMFALCLSALVWALMVVSVPCVLSYKYGHADVNHADVNHADGGGDRNDTAFTCFQFGTSVQETGALVFNGLVSSVIIVVACVLAALQANVLLVLYRRHGQACASQQVFWAQVKSLCFALVMVVFFVPYHVFRLHYVFNFSDDLQGVNEVFLSLTALCCLDMLTLAGKSSFSFYCRGGAT